MPRFVAFLRGVMPTNAKMADLKAAFARAGFKNIKTVLGSGNVVFDAPSSARTSLARKAESAMQEHLGRSFPIIVRPVKALEALLASDPYARFRLPPNAKRVVTFLRAAQKARLPVELRGARVLAMTKREAFSAYTPTPHGPVFMTLIEKTFGKDVTTR